MILLEIEYYKGDIILRGNTVPKKELLEQIRLIESKYDHEEDDFVAMLCRGYRKSTGKMSMKQPTRYEITEKIKGIVEGKISRDSVDDWVNYYISHDDEIEMIDIEAWHYLTELGTMCVQIAPNEYLYTTDDLLNLVKEYT